MQLKVKKHFVFMSVLLILSLFIAACSGSTEVPEPANEVVEEAPTAAAEVVEEAQTTVEEAVEEAEVAVEEVTEQAEASSDTLIRNQSLSRTRSTHRRT